MKGVDLDVDDDEVGVRSGVGSRNGVGMEWDGDRDRRDWIIIWIIILQPRR